MPVQILRITRNCSKHAQRAGMGIDQPGADAALRR